MLPVKVGEMYAITVRILEENIKKSFSNSKSLDANSSIIYCNSTNSMAQDPSWEAATSWASQGVLWQDQGSIKASVPLSVKISYVCRCEPFLENVERTFCVWLGRWGTENVVNQWYCREEEGLVIVQMLCRVWGEKGCCCVNKRGLNILRSSWASTAWRE